MTKLEEKLLELGYRTNWFYRLFSEIKYFNQCFGQMLVIKFDKFYNSYKGEVWVNPTCKTQQDVDNMQQAFNQLQKDLEVLKKYEC